MKSEDSMAQWPLSETAARQIARLRKQAGLSREELAVRCRAHGAPRGMSGAAITNIETGRPRDGERRRHITVDELAIFARALNVAPVALLFELGHVEMCEVLPGVVTGTWTATEWFTGEGPWEGLDSAAESFDETEDVLWHRNSAPLILFREHAQLTAAWSRIPYRAVSSDSEDEALTVRCREQRMSIAASLKRVREEMRRSGLRPPQLIRRLAEEVQALPDHPQSVRFPMMTPEERDQQANERFRDLLKKHFGQEGPEDG